MNVQQALNFAVSEINSASSNIDSSNIDAEFLLTYLLDKNTAWLKTWPEYILTDQQILDFKTLVARRKLGEPIAYITGERAFWNLLLETNSSTLIPRPETELLVETALDFLQPLASAKVLDLGTGTGAIALSIASERSQDDIFASDFNSDAVKLAERNKQGNQLNNVTVLQSDWFNQIDEKGFDLILSNPPYVAEDDPHLQQGDLVFEPDTALIAKNNGMADIFSIVKNAPKFLRSGGGLILEHGYQQAELVKQTLIDFGFGQIKTIKDLVGLDRVTLAIYVHEVS